MPPVSALAGPAIDWAEQLAPRGSETRLGDALRYVVDKERGGPIAGVIVFTDGGSNAGIDTTEAVAAAADANLAVFPVGFGSASRPANVAIVDHGGSGTGLPRRSFRPDRLSAGPRSDRQDRGSGTGDLRRRRGSCGGRTRRGVAARAPGPRRRDPAIEIRGPARPTWSPELSVARRASRRRPRLPRQRPLGHHRSRRAEEPRAC